MKTKYVICFGSLYLSGMRANPFWVRWTKDAIHAVRLDQSAVAVVIRRLADNGYDKVKGRAIWT